MAEDEKNKERKISKKARVEILLEDLTKKVDTILEGREVTDNKIDRLEQKVDANKVELMDMIKFNNKVLHEKIDNVRDELKQDIQRLEEGQQKTDKKIDKLDEKMTIRQDKIEEKIDIVHQKVFIGH